MVHGIVVPVGTGVRTKTDVGLKTTFTRSRSCLGLNTLWSCLGGSKSGCLGLRFSLCLASRVCVQ